MPPKIETPVSGFNGSIAGVRFTNGEGHTNDSNALAYFERHGYKVKTTKEPVKRAAKTTVRGSEPSSASEGSTAK